MGLNWFTIQIRIDDVTDENVAIAKAGMYLAYADTTETIGYNPNIKRSTVKSSPNTDGDKSVTITLGVNIQDDQHLEAFIDEIERLSRVVSFEHQGDMVVSDTNSQRNNNYNI